jgi:hypothetical protein
MSKGASVRISAGRESAGSEGGGMGGRPDGGQNPQASSAITNAQVVRQDRLCRVPDALGHPASGLTE